MDFTHISYFSCSSLFLFNFLKKFLSFLQSLHDLDVLKIGLLSRALELLIVSRELLYQLAKLLRFPEFGDFLRLRLVHLSSGPSSTLCPTGCDDPIHILIEHLFVKHAEYILDSEVVVLGGLLLNQHPLLQYFVGHVLVVEFQFLLLAAAVHQLFQVHFTFEDSLKFVS